MKSIKPGRGPSMMSGVMGIFVALFGVVWTVIAASMGGGLFALFGIFFVGAAIASTVYNFKNATGKNRYSAYDITDGNEEPDPFNERFGNAGNSDFSDWNGADKKEAVKYCPYCGSKAEKTYEYCSNCGKKLP